MAQIQKRLGTIALRGVTVLPEMSVFLEMNRSISISAATEAQKKNQEVFLVTQRDPLADNPDESQLERYGVIGYIRQILKTPGKNTRVLVNGIQAAELIEVTDYVPHLQAEVRTLEREEVEKEEEAEAMIRILKDKTAAYLQVKPTAAMELKMLFDADIPLDSFLDRLAANLPFRQAARQEYLELCGSDRKRLDYLSSWLDHETEVESYRIQIQGKVREEIDENQKQYVLREQMKVIRGELGDSAEEDADRYEKALSELKAPDEVKEQIAREIRRLRQMNYAGPEAGIAQNYIETLLEMPWEIRTEENSSVADAQKVLEEDHYGLEKVKEQILEFLSVRQLKGDTAGQVLCLVGPPGTGKTSVARSIARALNRKYVRISLGGVRDEAEIRGHRRTYIAAMPGRIAEAIKKAGVKNPLILLDELDKVSSDEYRGDTASALLEVLDREQNFSFKDHYLEVGLDLSEVLFVATANTLQTVPRPLIDRMEIIEIESYTSSEKYHIAEQYLIPKQMEKSGLKADMLQIDRPALEEIIHSYTREAGVRGLERQIEKICRKTARKVLENDCTSVKITKENLEEYLGTKKMRILLANKESAVGVVRGLAWTSVGGDTLQVEVSRMPGKGELILTGQMGDVMKESARIALSYVRSAVDEKEAGAEYFEKSDFHIHIPEGAVPKDGPSAGVTLATALYSVVTGRPVRPDLAMTGEVTLRGKVLAIGGLKEKLLAAKAAGIFLVLVPEENREDISELPEEVKENLTIRYVENVKQVFDLALEEKS